LSGLKELKLHGENSFIANLASFFICISFAGIFLYLGGIIYAQIIETHLSFLQRIGLFVSAIIGVRFL